MIRITYSSQFLTSSSWTVGIELICNGGRVKSEKMRTISNCFKPNWTRSNDAISISLRVTTRKGGSERCTKHSVVGCNLTFVRKGTPSKANSRKGISASNVSPVCRNCQEWYEEDKDETHRCCRCFSYLFCKVFEFFVKSLPALSLLLLKLNLILISISVFPLPVACFIELYIRGFSVKLNILRRCIQHRQHQTRRRRQLPSPSFCPP